MAIITKVEIWMTERLLKKIPNFIKVTYVEYKTVNELQGIKNMKKTILRYILKKITQNNDKEQISKVSREKDLLPTMKQMLHSMTTWTKVWINAEAKF